MLTEESWPNEIYKRLPLSKTPEKKMIPAVILFTISETHSIDKISRFSSFTRVQRILSYVRRFALRFRLLPSPTGSLTIDKLYVTSSAIIPGIQFIFLENLLLTLRSKSSKITQRSIARLVPFIDNKGIIRVGDQNSALPFDQQCPILLPKRWSSTHIIIQHYHRVHLHSGLQLVSSLHSQ